MKPSIFVFGSNLAGHHGKGAALFALNNRGAIYCQGVGRQGNSYAIPTRDRKIKTLPLPVIQGYVTGFLEYARRLPQLQFEVTRVGCGYAGYIDCEMAPLFKGAPSNCLIPKAWEQYL
jgi:hypothetical protein